MAPGTPIESLQQSSDQRLNEFTASDLPPPESSAVKLLERVAADGWLDRKERRNCPNCSFELSKEAAGQTACPECGEAYGQHAGVTTETVYFRNLAPTRNVEWVIALHGMNTTGSWQEAFSWYFATTWGRSVPVSIYKYGIVISGVVMSWRRRNLQNNLRNKLATLRNEANARGFSGKPDVISHSFGTWLFGHLLKDELKRKPDEQLRFGRIILTGCVLRPDYDWKRVKDAGLVDDVLNHYGSKAAVVPMAHATIWDSGPSGRRGFDGDQVLNILAEGHGHSDLFSISKCVVNGKSLQDCMGDVREISQLEYTYKRYWRPFLTLPRQELNELPDRVDPVTTWRQLWWPLRGTMFPFLALPLLLALIALLVGGVGKGLWVVWRILGITTGISMAGLLLLLTAIAMAGIWRRIRM